MSREEPVVHATDPCRMPCFDVCKLAETLAKSSVFDRMVFSLEKPKRDLIISWFRV